ncbi:MAG: hypothetical protein AAGC44_14575 [Planctomycetota bacterium]
MFFKTSLKSVAATLTLALGLLAAASASAQFGPVPTPEPGPSAPAVNAPIPALQGQWLCQSINGQQIPAGFSLAFNFVDAQTLMVVASANGEQETGQFRYQATQDGRITLFEDANDPTGESGIWRVEKGQLIITSNTNGVQETVVFTRGQQGGGF